MNRVVSIDGKNIRAQIRIHSLTCSKEIKAAFLVEELLHSSCSYEIWRLIMVLLKFQPTPLLGYFVLSCRRQQNVDFV
jgi:hypothetical protein